jgi:hypothetical protein
LALESTTTPAEISLAPCARPSRTSLGGAAAPSLIAAARYDIIAAPAAIRWRLLKIVLSIQFQNALTSVSPAIPFMVG